MSIRLFGLLAVLTGILSAFASDSTLAQQQTLPSNTVVGRLNVSAGPAQAIPIPQLLKNVIGPNNVPNSALAQMPATSFKCNPSAAVQDAQDCTLQGLPFNSSPNFSNDRLVGYDSVNQTLYGTSPNALVKAWTAPVASYTRSDTGAAAQTVQQRLDSGVIYSSDFGTVCDGSTADGTAMTAFLTALAARGNATGIITSKTPGNVTCLMVQHNSKCPRTRM